MLEVTTIDVYYGEVQALKNVSLKVLDGESVTVIGANGAGKSTLLKTVSGLLRPREGSIRLDGHDLKTIPPYEIAALGIAHVPEGRRVFAELSVQENLEMGAYLREAKKKRPETMSWVFEIFPILKDRSAQLGGTLSGGEQQMLAIARGLMLRPRLLMLDEPSLGLAPIMAETTFEKIDEIHREGISILLVEQNVVRALTLVQRGYILGNGQIVLQGTARELLENEQVKDAYLGLAVEATAGPE
jgi:branched-chain amino acid transport system ATP-binding protein